MERLCLDCRESLSGRTDKKFCNDLCRSNYNNMLRLKESPTVKKINSILKKNHKILDKLNPGKKAKVSQHKLLASGFNFAYFTHLHHTARGSVYQFCYDMGYMSVAANAYLIIRKIP